MREDSSHSMSVAGLVRSSALALLRVLATGGGTAVLLCTFVGHSAVHGEDRNESSPWTFTFACEFELPIGRGCLEGLMASDGSQHRIAIYWIEPDIFRDGPAFVRYTDSIFGPDALYYWVYPNQQQEMIVLSDDSGGPLLPRENSGEAIIKSAWVIVRRMKDEGTDAHLEIGRFFQSTRGVVEYAYAVPQSETDANALVDATESDMQALNALPGGRTYSKETRSDGAFVWRATRTLSGQPVAVVTVTSATRVQEGDCPGVFDPNTLGQWTLIPEPYRTYWAFDRAYCELDDATDERVASRELYNRIESYLDDSNVSREVHWGMDRLAIKTALITDDMDRVRRSVQEAVEGLRADPSVGRHRCLLELARISGMIQKRYPEEPQEWLRPFVSHVVEHAGREGVANYLDKLMPTIEANKWLIYGNLLLEEVRRQGFIEEQALHRVSVRLEGVRLGEEKRQQDPRESSPSVRDYLARLDTNPPQGAINMSEVRHILESGLAKCGSNGSPEAEARLVEDIVQSIRLIVGEGPFCGDPNELTRSIERFAKCYSVLHRDIESIGTTLATFLALSFCDLSTREDPDMLLSQFRTCSADLQSQVNMMLNERKFDSFVTPLDVNVAFQECEREFRKCIDNPLWPPFKFPWTTNEQARLSARLESCVIQLTAVLDEVSLKVQYGGGDTKLQERIAYEISRLADQLVAEAAFLRRPMYPGVSCHYRGRYGFTARIEGPFYLEGDRPKEKFKAMKYFHLGHRLERVVEHERELIQPSGAQEPSQ